MILLSPLIYLSQWLIRIILRLQTNDYNHQFKDKWSLLKMIFLVVVLCLWTLTNVWCWKLCTNLLKKTDINVFLWRARFNYQWKKTWFHRLESQQFKFVPQKITDYWGSGLFRVASEYLEVWMFSPWIVRFYFMLCITCTTESVDYLILEKEIYSHRERRG